MSITESRPTTESTELDSLRAAITDYTSVLLGTLVERTLTAKQIGDAKCAEGRTQVRDPEREAAVLDRMVAENAEYPGSPLTEDQVRRFGQLIMDIASEAQVDHTGLQMGDESPVA